MSDHNQARRNMGLGWLICSDCGGKLRDIDIKPGEKDRDTACPYGLRLKGKCSLDRPAPQPAAR